jgi:hypothetical protein
MVPREPLCLGKRSYAFGQVWKSWPAAPPGPLWPGDGHVGAQLGSNPTGFVWTGAIEHKG